MMALRYCRSLTIETSFEFIEEAVKGRADKVERSPGAMASEVIIAITTYSGTI